MKTQFSPIWIAICALSISLLCQATEIKRYSSLGDVGYPAEAVSISELSKLKLRHSDIWVFEDHLAKNQKELLEHQLGSLVRIASIFERQIVVRMWDFLFENSVPRVLKPILLLDNLDPAGLHKAFVDRRHLENDGYNIINMDYSTAYSSAFVPAAFHELQHLVNNFYKTSQGRHEEDWLNEGLSAFLESYFTGALPKEGLYQALAGPMTEPLFDWPANEKSALVKNYASKFLFVAYLYHHFGKEKLIRNLITSRSTGTENAITRIQELNEGTLPSEWLDMRSIFVNYSLALYLNSRHVGERQMFAIAGSDLDSGLQNFKITPEHLTTKPVNGMMIHKFSLSPYQSAYYQLYPGQYCIQSTQSDDVFGYIIQEQSSQGKIRKLPNRFCVSPKDFKHKNIVLMITSVRERRTEPVQMEIQLSP